MLVGLALAAPAVLLVLALLGYPLMSVVVDVIAPTGRQAVAEVFASAADRSALIRTVRVSAVVAVLSLLLGSVLAWALCTTKSRIWKAVLWIAVLAPFWMSVVVKNYAFVLLLRQGGPITTALEDLGLLQSGTDLLYTEGAVVAGMVYAMLPYAVLPLYATFSSLDFTLITAAESLGAGRARALWNIAAPLCAQGILSAGTLVFVISLGFYVTPVILGGPGAPFAASSIGDSIFQYFNLDGAKALAVILLAIALMSVIISQLLSRLLFKGDGR
jgi:putative spermidine/putrescine transport system permease protein